MICDFCSAPNPQWICPCRFTYHHLLKDWMACDICVALIRCRDWNTLVLRSLEESSTGQLMEDMFGEDFATFKINEHHGDYRRRAAGEPRKRREGS